MKIMVYSSIFLVGLALVGGANANECGGTIIATKEVVRNGAALYLRTKDNVIHRLEGSCFHIRKADRWRYRKLFFDIWNQFDQQAPSAAFVAIQAVKVMKRTQDGRIWLFRNRNWYTPTADGGRVVEGRLIDQPLDMTVQTWNEIYSSPGTPSEFATRLGVTWHAYVLPEGEISTTSNRHFWLIPSELDDVHSSIRNNIIRFTPKVSDYGEFERVHEATIQNEVIAIDISFDSNIEDFSTLHYRFEFE